MEMPFDVLNRRLGKLRDSGVLDGDNTAFAVDIDSEMQDKFIFFPIEELEAVEIEDDRGRLNAGDGPEHCAAGPGENPNWVYNHARNALALWWRLSEDAKVAELEQERLAKRPEPGVYQGASGTHTSYFTVIVTDDRKLKVLHVDGHMLDYTDAWDKSPSAWTLQRIDVETGTIANG